MRNYILLTFIFLSISLAQAEEPIHRPQRTAEEEAQKITEMLCREVGGVDSVQRDTIYRMNLQMARARRISNTRQEELDRRVKAMQILREILTPQQYDRFANRQIEPSRPRRGGGEPHLHPQQSAFQPSGQQ